jgi:hypothetical protein
MVQSKFNLDFWFVSYNIFYTEKNWHAFLYTAVCSSASRARPSAALAYEQ